MPSLLSALLATALFQPGLSVVAPDIANLLAEAPTTAAPREASSPERTTTTTPAPAAATTPAPGGTPETPATGGKPSAAQQAVLERIRRLRDGDRRQFGSCSYRWDRWKLQPDGTRTTTYSCERPAIVDRTIGVNCTKLQINSYKPVVDSGGKGEQWAWGTWRLPEAGGEEQMVATLCANALPGPPRTPASTAVPAK